MIIYHDTRNNFGMRFEGNSLLVKTIFKYDGLISTLDRQIVVAMVIVENVFVLYMGVLAILSCNSAGCSLAALCQK
jgi:hypothetical protein